MSKPPKAGLPKPRYVDRAEINETFADSMGKIFFDGHTARFEFLAHRWDEPKPPSPPTGKAVTACRLVLSINGLVELINNLEQIRNALEANGTLKRDAPSGQPVGNAVN